MSHFLSVFVFKRNNSEDDLRETANGKREIKAFGASIAVLRQAQGEGYVSVP